MYHIFFIHSSVKGHLDCFQFLEITIKLLRTKLSKGPCSIVGHLLGLCPGVVQLGLEVELFSVSWESAKLISSGCTIDFQWLHSHQQWRSVPLAPHPRQRELSLVVLILVILTGVRWTLRAFLICVTLMTKDVDSCI